MWVITRAAVFPLWVMCFSRKCVTAREHTHGKHTGSLVIASVLPRESKFVNVLLDKTVAYLFYILIRQQLSTVSEQPISY